MVLETIIGTVIGYLANSFSQSKGGKQAKDELSEATWNWLKPLFIEEAEKETLENFKDNPDANKNKLTEKLTEKLNSDESKKKEFLKFYEKIEGTNIGSRVVNQYGQKSVNVEKNDGTINIA